MGCGSSKLDDEEAVLHCKQRSALLADAIRYRYALADAHAAYANSLRAVGTLLTQFLDVSQSLPGAAPSPLLSLPPQRKAAPLSPPPGPPGPPGHARNHSGGSHIEFGSSDEDDDSPLHSDHSSPIHLHDDDAPVNSSYVNVQYARSQPPPPSVSYEFRPSSETVNYGSVEELGSAGSRIVNVHYARNQPPQPSVSYDYRPSSEAVNYGSVEPPQQAMAYPYPYYGGSPPNGSNYYPYQDPYMNYGGGGGFFGASPPQNFNPMVSDGGFEPPTSSREPPPPPPPPKTSAWDFLNFFDTGDSYYGQYTPSRSSKEVREEEGIPDLEDEDNVVVKEAYGDPKFVASTSGGGFGDYPGKAAQMGKDVARSSVDEDRHRKSRSVETGSSLEHEVHVVEKSVVIEKDEERRGVSGYAPAQSYQNVSQIMQEIKNQFERASDSAAEVSKMLEVGKLPYNRHKSVYKVPVWMACGFPSTSKNEDVLFYKEDKAMGCGNLSSTLQKLYMWERKLLEEVKVEENMRILYSRKREQLRHMSDRGAEAEKIEALETYIRKLSTRIKIAIQVVDTISNNISRLRDEELWPQIHELIQGFMKMWSAMTECHHIQLQAVSEAKNLDSIVSSSQVTEAHINVTKNLELELVEWTGNFSAWLAAQRSYINSLNGWLLKGLHYEPEVTDDGVAPFSPGRLGAPPVFVICNYWSQSIDRISEKDVVVAMQSFAANVLQLWKQNSERRQRLMDNKEMDRTLRLIGREEQEIKRKLQAQNKKLVVYNPGGITISEDIMRQGHAIELGSLQLNLKQIFEAMKDFTASCTKAYEDLYERAEEERQKLSQEATSVS